MSRDWSAPDDFRALDDFFAFDTIDDFLPHNDDGSVTEPKDSWLSALTADDVGVLNHNDDFSVLSEADVIFHGNNIDDHAPINSTGSALGISNPEGSSFDNSGLPMQLINEIWGIPHMDSADPEEPKVELATYINPDVSEQTQLDCSTNSPPRKSRSKGPAKRSTTNKKKFKRTKISSENRLLLAVHFNVNPYPTDGELTLLSGKTGLRVIVIKRWFMNARSRKQASCCK
jgi:hypothetical protein